MTSIVGPVQERPELLRRLDRREKLLGALVAAEGIPHGLLGGLDLLVVRGSLPAATVGALSANRVPMALLVESAAELAAARAAGGALTVAAAAQVPDADIQLTGDGRARVVTSPDAARSAFAGGADLVVYDVPAMIGALVATLPTGRPHEGAPTGREPLVLLSGMLGDSSLWDDVAAGLADIALPWPSRIDLDDSVPEMALSVLAEAPPRFALAGHSLGAIVALEILRQAPERVTRLALLNASARGPSDVQLRSWDESRRRTERGEFRRVADELAEATLGARRRGLELLARNRRMAETVEPEGFLRQLAAQATRPDSRTSLAAIGVPVLVLSGELDDICPPELQQELAALCPRATLETVTGAGHMMPLEEPDRVTELLRGWLASGGPGGAGAQ
jgi:pimeloyl-ACP methyl ester carboxylesterase